MIPDLELEDGSNYQIGKYGKMRQRYLFENHHAMYTHLVLTEKLWKHLEEVDMDGSFRCDGASARISTNSSYGCGKEIKNFYRAEVFSFSA